jgi:hypothetical protein
MFPIILALVTLTLPVAARDTGQWENQPMEISQRLPRQSRFMSTRPSVMGPVMSSLPE